MPPKQPVSTTSNTCRAANETNFGKRARDQAWYEPQSKRKCLDQCKRTYAKTVQLGNRPHHAHSSTTSGLGVDLSDRWRLPFTMESLMLWLTPELVESLQLQAGLSIFYTAPSRPLITQSYLGELDFILCDAKFRHNINFEKKGIFQPNYQGDMGRRKVEYEQQYWEAMSIEFAIYTRCRRLVSTHQQIPSWLPCTTIVPGISIPWRFPQMLTDLSDVICMVVPRQMWNLVRQRFDVPLIMQKLSCGIFKLDSLIEWLGMLLQRSCAPHRDIEIRAAVAATTQAMLNNDLKDMVLSLKRFFYIIETMKLDSVNYCIKRRRTAIVDATVAQAQTFFRQEIETKRFFITEAQGWFQTLVEATRHNTHDIVDLQDILIKGVIDLVTTTNSKHPSTWLFDTDRLQCLQTRFRYKLHKEIIRRTLAHFAIRSKCEHKGASTLSSHQLLSRIDALVEPVELASEWSTTSRLIALEIVRCLPEFNGSNSVPTSELLQKVELFLKEAGSDASNLHRAAEEHLHGKLRPLVAKEVTRGKHWTLSQLSNYCPPRPCQDQAPMTQQEELEAIARKIAHLSILHWRIWGPTLYQQLYKEENGHISEAVSRVAEVGARGSCTQSLCSDSDGAMFASSSSVNHSLV